MSGRKGYLVIDRLVRGVCSGGSGCGGLHAREVRGLAAGMTLKEGLHYQPGNRYVPLGGAKGGIDCSPQDPDARGVLVRYLRGVRALLEAHWTMGEDLGLRQETIDEVLAEMGCAARCRRCTRCSRTRRLPSRRLHDAFRIDVDGVGLDELVGGWGRRGGDHGARPRASRTREPAWWCRASAPWVEQRAVPLPRRAVGGRPG